MKTFLFGEKNSRHKFTKKIVVEDDQIFYYEKPVKRWKLITKNWDDVPEIQDKEFLELRRKHYGN